MEGTIGGKPISEVFCSLQKDIPGVVRRKKNTNYPYLEISVLKTFFESHVPPENYDFLCGTISLHQMNGEGFVACDGTLVIYADDGREVRRRSYVGAVNLTFSKTDGSLSDPAAAVKSAVTAARKGCMSLFGCGEKQLEEEKARRKVSENFSRPHQGSVSAGRAPEPSKAQNQMPLGTGEVPYGEGKYLVRAQRKAKIRSANSYFLIPVQFRSGRATNVLVWRNAFPNAGQIADQIAAGNEIAIIGTFEPYGSGDRIVCKKLE